LKLKKIITRKADSSLGGIKLVFHDQVDEIESDMFDSKEDSTNAIATYELKDKPLKSIKIRVNP